MTKPAKPGITITGLDEMIKLLGNIEPKHARGLARTTVHAVASVAAKLAKQKAPKDEGTLRKAIKAKRRKARKGVLRSDVIVTRGKSEKANAWYWKFVEYGTKEHAATDFMQRTAREIESKLPSILEQQFKKKLVQRINREKKKLAKAAK